MLQIRGYWPCLFGYYLLCLDKKQGALFLSFYRLVSLFPSFFRSHCLFITYIIFQCYVALVSCKAMYFNCHTAETLFLSLFLSFSPFLSRCCTQTIIHIYDLAKNYVCYNMCALLLIDAQKSFLSLFLSFSNKWRGASITFHAVIYCMHRCSYVQTRRKLSLSHITTYFLFMVYNVCLRQSWNLVTKSVSIPF